MRQLICERCCHRYAVPLFSRRRKYCSETCRKRAESARARRRKRDQRKMENVNG